MSALTDTFRLGNGERIPAIGFGTWQIPEGPVAYDSVSAALAAGYRHIDTARAYGNEASVGRAIRDSGIAREDLFVTTKLPAEVKDFDGAHASFEVTMSALGLDYVDLYLIHAPWPWDEIGKDCRAGNIAAWSALEQVHDSGRSRAIGVSNFDAADLESLISATRIVPHANQIQYFVGNTKSEIVEYCTTNGILVEGYSPLATGRILDDPRVRGIAEKYGVSVAQVCIRYVLEHGIVALPKSTTPARIVENGDVDFDIAPDDLDYLDSLTDTVD